MDRSPVPGAGAVRDEDAFDLPAVAAGLRYLEQRCKELAR